MSKRDKITEIAIVVFDGEKIIEQYDTLINPERRIPAEITRITGITDEMVADAPKFYEVAKKVVELTEGRIFVAHNVRFDYGFLKEEFGRLGYSFSRRQLCTVRLSRTAFPGLSSYSLGNLIKNFDINVDSRHRALDDTLATLQVFMYILEEQNAAISIEEMVNKGIRESQLPKGIKIEDLHNLPEACGVYYFRNEAGQIVYVGKSINIQKRAFQHFRSTTKKSAQLAQMVSKITYELTGSELVSLLLESQEIKKLKPLVNRALRDKTYSYFVYHYLDEEGYLCFGALKNNKKNIKAKKVLSYYSSKAKAAGALKNILKEFSLCDAKCEVGDGRVPCFSHSIGLCYGACFFREESAEDYNLRAQLGLEYLQRVFDDNFIVIDIGRTSDESSIVLVEEGNYKGFGYIGNTDLQYGIEELKEAVKYQEWNPDNNQIIRTYLESHPGLKVIRY